MDIQEELLAAFSKSNTVRVAGMIGNDLDRFNTLVSLVLKADGMIAARAAWVMRHCYDAHPWLVEKHIPFMIKRLSHPACDGVKRNILAILQAVEIPKVLEGILADQCFKMLNDASEPVAIKVFSMNVIFNLVLKYTDLKAELEYAIQTQLPYGSTGFKNRGEKILRHLARL